MSHNKASPNIGHIKKPIVQPKPKAQPMALNQIVNKPITKSSPPKPTKIIEHTRIKKGINENLTKNYVRRVEHLSKENK